ncbi:dachshund homolog 2-like [Herpailurus yagouaroundi]|uniref:dachshund homolog 2-like n=1 Tax=Herpailurus yagouaroundi TaxID=1608482 RepID=UPI001AD7DAB4|nr:dachshund homolog 2-like [Puma yagouaroundi]
MAEAMKLQKMKLMAMNTLQGNGNQNGAESEPDDLNSNTGESESSWDKDKLQSLLAAPGPQHGLTHAALSNQPGLGGASTLNPLQQNNLLTNSMYDRNKDKNYIELHFRNQANKNTVVLNTVV